jgi:aryl-alcohol dehydrogenase-like predicted oxidoreductase
MEYRTLGTSTGFTVPVLSLGTGTFGGTTDFFKLWGQSTVKEAMHMIDICMDNGINFFDTANVYSLGASEEILGAALKKKRDKALISTKAGFSMGDSPWEKGLSRHHIMRACEESLKRLGTDHIDLYFVHGPSTLTPVEETLRALDDLVSSGKVSYIGCSNFSGWHVMKSLATSEKYGYSRYISYQGYYSLLNREYEWELMPMAKDQGMGLMVWSPLGWGRLTGKIRRGSPLPEGRIKSGGESGGPKIDLERVYTLVEALDSIAKEVGKTVTQVAINWLLQRPTVSNIIIGARTEAQLKENIGSVGWHLTQTQIEFLDDASRQHPIYPYWHHMGYEDLMPPIVKW